jgi:hypothetical protein
MNKEEIVRAVRGSYCSTELDRLADAVSALDVCTPAEREYIEAGISTPWELATEEQLKRYRTAWDAVVAERTPPDPVETFIAEVRGMIADPHAHRFAVAGALAKLDAARGRKL